MYLMFKNLFKCWVENAHIIDVGLKMPILSMLG